MTRGLFKNLNDEQSAGSELDIDGAPRDKAEWGASNQRVVERAKALLSQPNLTFDGLTTSADDIARRLQEADDYRFAQQLQLEEDGGLPAVDPARAPVRSSHGRPLLNLWTTPRSTGSRDPSKPTKRAHQQAADRMQAVITLTGAGQPSKVRSPLT